MMDKIDAYQAQIVPLAEEDGGGYMATFPQLGRMIVGYGETREEALRDLQGSVPTLIESMQEHGEAAPAPEAVAEWQDYSGRVTLRLPKMLHRQLDRLAEREGVSLNALMGTMLQSGATAMLAGHEFGAVQRVAAKEPASQVSRAREKGRPDGAKVVSKARATTSKQAAAAPRLRQSR